MAACLAPRHGDIPSQALQRNACVRRHDSSTGVVNNCLTIADHPQWSIADHHAWRIRRKIRVVARLETAVRVIDEARRLRRYGAMHQTCGRCPSRDCSRRSFGRPIRSQGNRDPARWKSTAGTQSDFRPILAAASPNHLRCRLIDHALKIAKSPIWGQAPTPVVTRRRGTRCSGHRGLQRAANWLLAQASFRGALGGRSNPFSPLFLGSNGGWRRQAHERANDKRTHRRSIFRPQAGSPLDGWT